MVPLQIGPFGVTMICLIFGRIKKTYLKRLFDGNARVEETKESLRKEPLLNENAAQRAWTKKVTVAKKFPSHLRYLSNVMLTHIIFVTIRNSFV